MPTPPQDCKHINLLVNANVARVIKEEDNHLPEGEAAVQAFVLELNVWCSECKTPFSFEWTEAADPTVVPLSLSLMKKRPWVSFMKEQLGVVVKPMAEGGRYLGETTQVGHA